MMEYGRKSTNNSSHPFILMVLQPSRSEIYISFLISVGYMNWFLQLNAAEVCYSSGPSSWEASELPIPVLESWATTLEV